MPSLLSKMVRRVQPDKAHAVMESRVPDRKERSFIERTLKVPIYEFTDKRAYLQVGCKKVWASFRACHLTASVLLSTQFRVQGKATGAEVENADLTRVLTSPNPFDSWEEILYMWVFHMKLVGEAFWYKDQMDYRGRPKYLYPMLPQYMAVVPHPTEKIDHYIYRVNGKQIRFERDEIIHFRRPHPMKIHGGLGDVEPSESLYREYIMRGTLEERFLSNGAMPSGILTKKEAEEDEDEWAKLKKWWKSEYEGERNVGKTAFLNGEWTYTKLGLTHSEMQSIENEKWSIEQIFINHGVPLSVAGIDGAANYATARQDEINFRRYEVVPLIDLLVGKLNSDQSAIMKAALIKAWSPAWEMTYELSGLIDVEQVVKDYKPLVDVGAMTLNQLRELAGLEADEGNPLLDQYFVNSNRVPIEFAGLTAPTEEEIDNQNKEDEKPPKPDEGEGDKPPVEPKPTEGDTPAKE